MAIDRFWQGMALCAAGMAGQALAANGYYVNPDSTAARWVEQHASDSRAALIKASIADVPTARWFTGSSQSTGALKHAVASYTTAAQAAEKVPILVAYNIPGRDCAGGASAGGASNAADYREWIGQFIGGIGARQALVILEPDAIADLGCLAADKQTERLALLQSAITAFASQAPAAKVYLDAGNAYWQPAATVAKALNQAGVKAASGFALNVSNYYTTAQSQAYAGQVNGALSGANGYTKPWLIDTSRNGKGANPGDWCNPSGRKLGVTPQALSSTVLAVWAKVPGNSDGASSPTTDCHGGPAAGVFSPALAVKLINGG